MSIRESYASAHECGKQVYDRLVAARLEDTLTSGYTRLAAETPRRRIDVELRILDVLFAAFFGLLLLPAIVVIALATLASDGRPVFYRGERVGRHGRFFTITKFRTAAMQSNARPVPRRRARCGDRGQYTRLGRWLKSSELGGPAALERSSGDMSLVGPRPIQAAVLRRARGDLPRTGNGLSFVESPGFAQMRRGYETSMAGSRTTGMDRRPLGAALLQRQRRHRLARSAAGGQP